MPETQEAVLGDAQRAEKSDRAEKGEVGIGIASAVKGGQFEAILQAREDNRRPVQRFGYIGERVCCRAHGLSRIKDAS